MKGLISASAQVLRSEVPTPFWPHPTPMLSTAAPLHSASDHALEACGNLWHSAQFSCFPPVNLLERKALNIQNCRAGPFASFLAIKLRGSFKEFPVSSLPSFLAYLKSHLENSLLELACPSPWGRAQTLGPHAALGWLRGAPVSHAGSDQSLGALDTVHRPPSLPVKEKFPGAM